MEQNAVSRVVVAPHCDDETLGCGGLIAKHSDSTAVVVLAEPDAVREKEFLRAKDVLRYAEHRFLNVPDGSLDTDMRALVGELDVVLSEWRPQELYLPFPSLHQDHIAAYEAGMRSARLSMTEGHWFPPAVYVYDVAVYDTVLYPTDLKWNIFESLSEEHIDRKVEALEAYNSQAVTGPHPSNAAKQMAHALGVSRQVAWAEQFALIRKVRA
jgi:LmbE family N-acetylglucosaminyl deacetylase